MLNAYMIPKAHLGLYAKSCLTILNVFYVTSRVTFSYYIEIAIIIKLSPYAQSTLIIIANLTYSHTSLTAIL